MEPGEAVQAAQTGDDVLRLAVTGLFGEVGVGDALAGHGDDVGLALGQNLLRQLRGVDAPQGDHRGLATPAALMAAA